MTVITDRSSEATKRALHAAIAAVEKDDDVSLVFIEADSILPAPETTESITSGLVALASVAGKFTLRSITAKGKKLPVDAKTLTRIAVFAWHEACGLPVPDDATVARLSAKTREASSSTSVSLRQHVAEQVRPSENPAETGAGSRSPSQSATSKRTNNNIPSLWAEVDDWLKSNMPDAVPMPEGVSSLALEKSEKQLGFRLSSALKEFWQVHDGSRGIWLHKYGVLNSLNAMLQSWEQEVDPWGDGENDHLAEPKDPSVKKKWFARKWLPIVDSWTGDYLCVDLDPSKKGSVGQIVYWRHDAGPVNVAAPSFESLFQIFVDELKAGVYVPKVNNEGKPYLDSKDSD
jgi:cell wall assembly regulator SMI1